MEEKFNPFIKHPLYTLNFPLFINEKKNQPMAKVFFLQHTTNKIYINLTKRMTYLGVP